MTSDRLLNLALYLICAAVVTWAVAVGVMVI